MPDDLSVGPVGDLPDAVEAAAKAARAHAMRSIARMIETRDAAGLTEPELAAKLRRMADATAPEETNHA